MVHKFFVAFIPIFVAIDAIGLVAVFMGLAGDTPREQRQREGFIAIFTALCISVGFIFLGKIIFTALGITVADFQVAGGLILLGLAGRELLNVAPASREATNDFGVVPLGMPLIAGPALLTALLVLVDTVGLVFTICSASGQSRAGSDRVLECRFCRALDGQTRVTRCVENSGAPTCRHRRQSDPPRLARRVSVAKRLNCMDLGVDVLDAFPADLAAC